MRVSLPLLALAAASALCAGTFRASVVKVDITPPGPQWLLGYPERKSTGVHDRIYHRIVALDDGAGTFILVSTDICLVAPSFYDEVAAQVQKRAGIPPSHFWWTATHTHSAPELGPLNITKAMMPERFKHELDLEYTRHTVQLLVEGIRKAKENLAPARLAVGTGWSNANINRRARDPEGKISLGLNPDGPVDRQIGLIRLTREDGSLLALIANYSMHGTVLGGSNLLISGDAPGIVAEYVEGKLGAPMLFINGAAGDTAPIYSVMASFKASHITEFNVLLGDRILAAYNGMGAPWREVSLRAGEKWIETPLRKDFRWDDSMKAYLRVTGGGESLVRIPVRFLNIGNELAVWAAPLELFSEISMNVRRQSPFPYTFYFGYTNGWMGYLATRQACAQGGYETGPATSFVTDRAEEDFSQGVIAYLKSISH
jgi:neutral ceramidase